MVWNSFDCCSQRKMPYCRRNGWFFGLLLFLLKKNFFMVSPLIFKKKTFLIPHLSCKLQGCLTLQGMSHNAWKGCNSSAKFRQISSASCAIWEKVPNGWKHSSKVWGCTPEGVGLLSLVSLVDIKLPSKRRKPPRFAPLLTKRTLTCLGSGAIPSLILGQMCGQIFFYP